ncbi:hypothetical protein LCGC14_0434880 [marine sediment metagenome]|uniref:Uncharacterized protein n=1 Tax=marine sediment metagenome TaxID=412755 RepID=A0A0F9V902_9ZZZZ
MKLPKPSLKTPNNYIYKKGKYSLEQKVSILQDLLKELINVRMVWCSKENDYIGVLRKVCRDFDRRFNDKIQKRIINRIIKRRNYI